MDEKKFEFISEILEFTQNYILKGAESMYKYGIFNFLRMKQRRTAFQVSKGDIYPFELGFEFMKSVHFQN